MRQPWPQRLCRAMSFRVSGNPASASPKAATAWVQTRSPDAANATPAATSAIRATDCSIARTQPVLNSVRDRHNSSQRAALAPMATRRDPYSIAFALASNTAAGSGTSLSHWHPMRSGSLLRALHAEAEIALRHVPVIAGCLPADNVLAVGELAFEVSNNRCG